jgi:hypothetical protein
MAFTNSVKASFFVFLPVLLSHIKSAYTHISEDAALAFKMTGIFRD